MITRNFNLYLNAGHSVPLVINVNQYDSGEQWVFTLYNADGTKYTPSTGAIVGIKSDGLGIINSGSVVDGNVVINETQQMTAAVGKAVFELTIDSGTHGTANFVVLVEEKPGNNADLSDSDLSLIQEALDAVNPLPTGGSVGQVLTKTENGSAWTDAGTPTQEQVADAVSDWADEHITVSAGVVIDTSLSVAGAAADAKATGDEITDLKSAIFNSADATWEQGGVVLASGWLEDNSKRCRTNKFFLKKGATFTINPSGLWYNFAKYSADDDSYLAYQSSWTSDGLTATYSVDYDAYIIVWLRNADNTDLSPTDVTATVTFENDLVVEAIDNVVAVQAALPKASVRMEVYPAANGLGFSGNLAVNDPLVCTVNNIFYFRNTDNLGGVAYLNRQGGTFSIATGYGLFFDFTARTLEVLFAGTYVPPNKLLLLGKEGTIINGLWAVYYYQKAQYVNAQGQTVWIVGNGYIPTIQAACDLAADGDIIFVKCGTYTEQVSIWTRELHIIGEDKVNTILIDHSGNYDTPPLEMAMGSLSNMTIIEDGATPTVEPSDGRYMMAYCLHIEHPNAAGKTFVIDNCDFINDIHVPLGCGMRANNTVHFRNCTFRCNATSESTSAERGGFFVHAQNAPNIANQNVIIENCIISSAGPRLALLFGVPSNADNTGNMNIRMSGCTVWNENRGIADNAVGWDTSGGTDVMSIVHSYGNTIARLNTTT